MVMIEQSQQIFGLIAKIGYQDRCAIMGIKIATTNQHREDLKQAHKAEKEHTKGVKYQPNYVTKF